MNADAGRIDRVPAGMDRAFEAASTQAARLDGRRAEMESRYAALVSDVGMAKARLSVKAGVDAFLLARQARQHQKTLEDYGTMLSAIVSDVISPGTEIGLEVGTENGLPSLDVFARENGETFQLMEEKGLSVTNVVCLGLRAIAVVRSGLRPFLALDEPDVWISQARARHFYRVIKAMAERLGFQVVVISHHDPALFSDGISIVELTGTKDTRTAISLKERGPAWHDAEVQGIREVRARDFRTFEDVRIPLCPGVTALVGDNDLGKSGIMRMLRSVCFGGKDTSDRDIRRGRPRAMVDIVMERGRTLSWVRDPAARTAMHWKLTERDGAVAEIDGARCEGPGESGGKKPPSWVAEATNIRRLEDMDIQLSLQRQPIFLLDEGPSKRAKVLCIGRESGKLQEMIARQKADCAADAHLVRDGEKSLTELRDRLAVLDGLDAVRHGLDTARAEREAAVRELEAALAVEDAARAVEAASMALARAEARAEAVHSLPDAPDVEGDIAAGAAAWALADTLDQGTQRIGILDRQLVACAGLPSEPPELLSCDEVFDLGRRMAQAHAGLESARARLDVLASLPDGAPELEPSDPIVAEAARIEALAAAIARAEAEAADAERQRTENKLMLAEAVLEMGGVCPTCGTAGLTHEHVLRAEAA